MWDATGCVKFKMAASKLAILLSQLTQDSNEIPTAIGYANV